MRARPDRYPRRSSSCRSTWRARIQPTLRLGAHDPVRGLSENSYGDWKSTIVSSLRALSHKFDYYSEIKKKFELLILENVIKFIDYPIENLTTFKGNKGIFPKKFRALDNKLSCTKIHVKLQILQTSIILLKASRILTRIVFLIFDFSWGGKISFGVILTHCSWLSTL